MVGIRFGRRLGTDALRVDEAAEYLGIDGSEVYHLVIYGELAGGPSVDGRVRVPREAVDLRLARLAAEAEDQRTA